MKPVLWQRVIVLFALLASIVAVVPASALAGEKITLMGIYGLTAEPLKTVLSEFTAKTGIEVDLIITTNWNEQRDKTVAMTISGNAPDVVFCDNAVLGYFALNNLALPLDDLVSRDNLNMSRYAKSVLAGVTLRKRLYALPTGINPYHLFYNVELFNKVGLAPLPTDWESNAFTWDDFVNISKKLTTGDDGTGNATSFGIDGLGWTGGCGMIGMWNQWIIDADEPIYYGDQPEVIAALEKTTSLWTKYGVVGGDFFQSTAAMTARQTVYMGKMVTNQASLNWSVGIMPKGIQRSTQSAHVGFAVTAGSKNPNPAWELVKYLAYDPKGAVAYSHLVESRLPVLRETAHDWMVRYSNALPMKQLQALTDSAAYAYDHNFYRHKMGPDIAGSNGIAGAVKRVLKGEAPVEQAMKEIAPTIRAMLAER